MPGEAWGTHSVVSRSAHRHISLQGSPAGREGTRETSRCSPDRSICGSESKRDGEWGADLRGRWRSPSTRPRGHPYAAAFKFNSVFSLAALTKYHKLDGLNTRHSFLTTLEAGRPSPGCRHRQGLGAFSSRLAHCLLLHVSSRCSSVCAHGEIERSLSFTFYMATNPTRKTPPS